MLSRYSCTITLLFVFLCHYHSSPFILFVYLYICIFVSLYICIFVYLYICIFVYLYICIFVLITVYKMYYKDTGGGRPIVQPVGTTRVIREQWRST